MKQIAVVGAGFSGAVIARELADAGYSVTVFDSRSHVAGNAHSARDPETGVMVHTYGPHIFHTSNQRVWEYLHRFDEMLPYVNRVKAVTGGRVFSLPINLLTINQFFHKTFFPAEAAEFVKTLGERSDREPETFEEQALAFLGRELYEAFFKGYTQKQWGISPAELPASILKRLPIRFNYDDNYYNSRYQGIPAHGFTHIVEKILDHPGITVQLNTTFTREMKVEFEHVFYSGPIDAWFDYSLGRLRYRTLDFAVERHEGDFQGNAVVNYCDLSAPFTRICEHKHLAPREEHRQTLIYREYSRDCGVKDIPYYPIPVPSEQKLLRQYQELAARERSVCFVGRLGTYRYLDMDVTVEEALAVAQGYLDGRGRQMV